MITETQARLLIMDQIGTMAEAHTSYPLKIEQPGYDTLDETLQINPYVKYFLDFMGTDQADLGENPLGKHVGQLQLHAVFKEGKGMMAGAALRTFMRPYFSLVNLGGVHFHMAEPHKGACIKGWEHLPLLVDFWYFSAEQ